MDLTLGSKASWHQQYLHRHSISGMARWSLRGLLVVLLYALLMQPMSAMAHNAIPAQTQPLVTVEVRYHLAEAGEVFLVWGVNGWALVPETIRPTGTVVKDKVMYTPMVHEGDTFVVKVQVPPGTTIDYVFQITKTRSGAAIEVWDANGEPKRDYHTFATQDGIAEVTATPILGRRVASYTAREAGPQWHGFWLLLIGFVLVFGIGMVVHQLGSARCAQDSTANLSACPPLAGMQLFQVTALVV